MTAPKQPTPPTPGAAPVPSSGKSQQGKPPPSMQDLEKQVARLTDIAARAQADLQNFKMRMERDAGELRTFVQSELLLRILPIVDDLCRALDHTPSEGLEQILKKLEKILTDAGAKKIETVGKHVDPLRHEVVNSGPGEKDVIMSIHEEGYELNGRVLRPAKVQVGDGSQNATNQVSPQAASPRS